MSGSLVSSLALPSGACGSSEHAEPQMDGLASLEQSEPSSRSTPTSLLAALAQNHRTIREQLGPHRLEVLTTFSLSPEHALGQVHVGDALPRAQSITDHALLEWASASSEPAAFRFMQENDHEQGREVVVVGETMYSRARHRNWFFGALQTDLVSLWLDELSHGVRDIVQLAAPMMRIDAAGSEPNRADGRQTLTFVLSTADTRDPTLIPNGHGQAWRQRAQVRNVSGSITLDRHSGVWLAADVRVDYSLDDGRGHTLLGTAGLKGTCEPSSAGTLHVSAPANASPTPERTRYELERARLLEGLTGT